MALSIQDLKGYDHQFVDKYSDGLNCLICLCVARDPQQATCCGKLLCRVCLEEHMKHSSNCPHCRKHISAFADTKSKQDILSLKALCDNSSNGCEWVGELCSLDEHLWGCEFTLLPCPNDCSKNNKVIQLLRKNLQKHTKEECPRRQYECPHCQEAGEYRERTTKHLKECPMVEVHCPKRRCTTSILRCDLAKHREECLFEKVPCKYSTIGCDKEVERKDLEEHEGDTEQHLQLAVDTVHQLQSKLADLPSKYIQMPTKFIFTNYDQHKMGNDEIYSPAFYTSPRGYKMCIRVDANGHGDGKGTHVSVFAYLMKGQNDDYLPWPFTGRVTVELLNQLEDQHHHSIPIRFTSDSDCSRVVNKERSSRGWGRPKYISHSYLGYNRDKNCQYLKDDRLHFKISVDVENSSTPWLI